MPRYPFPWWLVTDAPALAAASGPIYRATVMIAMAYGASGCSALPSDASTMARICRLPVSHVGPQKSAILKALATITPALDKAHAQRHQGYALQLAKVKRMNAARRQRWVLAKITESLLAGIHAQPQRAPSRRTSDASRAVAQRPQAGTGSTSTNHGVTFTD